MAEHNYREREDLALLRAQLRAQKIESKTKLALGQYYGTGVVIAVGVLGVIGYYVYKSKTPKETPVHQPKETPVQRLKEIPAHKFEME